jgi:hypothetical protein
MTSSSQDAAWPELSHEHGKDTIATMHLWTQIVGKIRLAQTPWLNHSWHVPLYVTAHGLATSLIPHGSRVFDIELDFVRHVLVLRVSDGAERKIALRAVPMAVFHEEVMQALRDCEVPVTIFGIPSEIPDAIAFSQDHALRSYDAEYAQRFWRALLQVHRVLVQFRSGFLGKVSPVHVFWGALDMAVTRFSGREAPPHPGHAPHMPDTVMREAYSHEVSSAGFWPGGPGMEEAAFYSYAYPEPEGFRRSPVRPEGAFFSEALGEFLLPYEAVRTAADPDAALLAFLESTYQAAADCARWDRAALECPPGRPGMPREVSTDTR